MRIYPLSSFIIFLFVFSHCSALPWGQGYLKYGKNNFIYLSPNKFWNNALNREPNCNELRAMWRFSMLKSRGTEMTNEIPTYRDPFAYNVWESRVRSKPLQNGPLQGSGSRGFRNHVYGKVIHTVPIERYSDKLKVNGRNFDDVAKFLMSDKPITPRRKNAEAFRLPNGAVTLRKLPALTDSFKRLKAVVRAQREKELHDQHLAEKSVPHGMVKDKNGRSLLPNPFEYLYNVNTSFSGKRSAASSKTLHFIPNPSSLIYGSSKYNDQFLAEHYVSDYGYYHSPNVVPMNMRNSVMPAHIPSHY